ncbi:MAG: T9SS type A sorting domain-containing protein [Calditrichaeota bacterium]|nr:T9SS type A sorting domain-containing protein [Calditrichota bacterium]
MSTFPAIGSNTSEILGGDFNEDGIGDIVRSGSANRGEGMTRFYFGQERWERQPEPDLEYRGRIDEGGYAGGMYGSVGDYNGDGADDYILAGMGDGHEFGGLYVVSGFDDGDAVDNEVILPISSSLFSDVYPNPFNSALTISVEVNNMQDVEVDVFDISGRSIESLHSGNLQVGNHSFNWGSNLSGIYFVVLSSGQYREIQKVVCVR